MDLPRGNATRTRNLWTVSCRSVDRYLGEPVEASDTGSMTGNGNLNRRLGHGASNNVRGEDVSSASGSCTAVAWPLGVGGPKHATDSNQPRCTPR